MSRPRLLLLSLAYSVLLLGCARMVPQRVAEGIAQLTVRQAGAVLQAVENDEACGFSSPAVLAAVDVEGVPRETGSATWTVRDCRITKSATVAEDCNGVATDISGEVVVTATKTLVGRVTGDPETPIIPESADAVTFDITDATFRDFLVLDSASTDHLRTVAGGFSAVISPQLVASAETGACSVVTPHVSFPSIVWRPSTVIVTSDGRSAEIPIHGGELEATNGRVGEHENRVAGELTVWSTPRTFNLEGAGSGLNPTYDAEAFETTYACSPDLKLPVTSTCDLEPVLAENAARLLIKTFGMLVKTTDLDEGCGFGNLEEQSEELLTLDSLGSLLFGGDRTLEFEAQTCPLGGDLYPIFENCSGTEYFLDGIATITGTQTVTGEVVIDWPPLHPSVPDQAEIALTDIDLHEVTVFERRAVSMDMEPSLTLHDGQLSGTYHSITGEAASAPGAYFVKTPVGEFDRIRLENSDVTLNNGAMQFPMHIDSAELYALNGSFQGRSNWLYGSITIDGQEWRIGEPGEPTILDPEFDQGAFDASYACTENLMNVVPPR